MKAREVEKLLLKDGWYLYDVVGSHHQYKHPIQKRQNNNPIS